MNIIIDFETRSRCDLKIEGGDNYALHESTEILCMAAVMEDPEDNREWLWYPADGELEDELWNLIWKAPLVMAHNAAFDRGIWAIGMDDHEFPKVEFDRWYCTSAQARVNAMPASLDKLTQALDSKYKKDFRGAQLIRQLCIPDKKTNRFNENPRLLKELGEYCLSDVRATKAASNALRPMTTYEHQDWLVNERINERGVKVDLPMAEAAMFYADMEQGEIAKQLINITDGVISKHSQHQRVNNWVRGKVCTNSRLIMQRFENGKEKFSLDKSVRAELITRASLGEVTIPDTVIQVLELVQAGNKSSVSKFNRMIGRADSEDSRVRGAFVYAGASQTLRYASRGLQLHNMRRDCFSPSQTEDLRQQMIDRYILEDDSGDLPVMDTLSKLLRPALIPGEGNVFVVGDWSSVEARALPWLSKSKGGDKKLDIFRAGKDVYVEAALAMGMTDSKDDRQIGKVAELSLGYGGAAGAFGNMAKNYGLVLPEYKVKGIVDTWRDKNSWAVAFWDRLHAAAIAAVKKPGEEFKAGRATYLFVENLMGGTLLCILPGDLIMQYPKAKLEILDTEYGKKLTLTAMKANWHPKQGDSEWPRISLWRGLLAENITQAFCARLLREVLLICPNVVGHVHDEIIMEVPKDQAAESLTLLETAMNAVPKWAYGMPLSAEPVLMTRYGK